MYLFLPGETERGWIRNIWNKIWKWAREHHTDSGNSFGRKGIEGDQLPRDRRELRRVGLRLDGQLIAAIAVFTLRRWEVLRWEGHDLPMLRYDHCICFLLLFNKLPQPQWINNQSHLLVPSILTLSSVGHQVQPTIAGSSALSEHEIKGWLAWVRIWRLWGEICSQAHRTVVMNE